MFRTATPSHLKPQHLLCALALSLLATPWARAQTLAQAPALSEAFAGEVRQLALQGARVGAPPKARVEVKLGELNPRLHLAPCQKAEPYLPPGQSMWGRTRIGMRCVQGPVRWNVTLPLTVQVFARALVANAPLAIGATLSQADLREAEIDIAADDGTVFTRPEQLVGRTLMRALPAGEAVRSSFLNQRRWFAAGDMVKVRALGQGYAVEGEGRALNPGIEDQDVRVRFDSGRVVTGRAKGERTVEFLL